MRTIQSLIAAFVLALIAMPAVACELKLEFSGTVFIVNDADNDGPPVSVGDTVDGYITYSPADATTVSSSPGYSVYDHPSGTMDGWVNFSAAGESFQLFASDGFARSYCFIDASTEFWRNTISAPSFSGSPTFPYGYAGGEASMNVILLDNAAPLTLLDTTALVDETSDVDLSAAVYSESEGSLGATEPAFLPDRKFWNIRWRLDFLSILTICDPISTEALSFGAVKALY